MFRNHGSQTELVRTSYLKICMEWDDFTHAYFDRLLRGYPEVKGIFPDEFHKQSKLLKKILELAANELRMTDTVVETLHRWGQWNAQKGATADTYIIFNDVLIATMAQFMGREWTRAHEDAWFGIMFMVADVCVDGTADDRRYSSGTPR